MGRDREETSRATPLIFSLSFATQEVPSFTGTVKGGDAPLQWAMRTPIRRHRDVCTDMDGYGRIWSERSDALAG